MSITGPKHLLNRPEAGEAPSAGWLDHSSQARTSSFQKELPFELSQDTGRLSLNLAKALWVCAVCLDKIYRSSSTERIPESNSRHTHCDLRKMGSHTWSSKRIVPRHTNPTLASSFMDSKRLPLAKRQKCSKTHLCSPCSFRWQWSRLETPRALFPTGPHGGSSYTPHTGWVFLCGVPRPACPGSNIGCEQEGTKTPVSN